MLAAAMIFMGLVLGMTTHHAGAQTYDQWRGYDDWGVELSCEPGEALTAVCGSGENRDCRQGSQEQTHKIRCVNPPGALKWQNGNDQKYIQKDWGQWAFCPSNHVATARCSGGGKRDCDGLSHSLTCTPVSSTAHIRMNPTDTRIICKDHGEDAVCPQGYVVTGSCGAGENPDCGTDWCAGFAGDVYTGVRCTRIYAYEYDSVGSYNVSQAPEFSFDGVCTAQTLELEGEESSRSVQERFTHKTSSSLQQSVSTTIQQGSSLTASLSVIRSIGIEVGLPKIGLGVSSSGSIEAGLERTTTFDRSESYAEQLEMGEEKTQEVQWDYELAGGLTWTLASWTARVATFGDYTLLYREYSPGRQGFEILDEEAIITTETLDERSFTLVLNSNNHNPSFLRSSSCTQIATEYMLGIGEFSDLTPETQVDEFLETTPGGEIASGESGEDSGATADVSSSVNVGDVSGGAGSVSGRISFAPLLGLVLCLAWIEF